MKKITLKIAFLFVAMFTFQAQAQVVLETVYTLRNVGNGEYLRSDATNRGVEPATALPSDTTTEDAQKFNFLFRTVEVTVDDVATTAYNIVSLVKGCLRGAGAGAGSKVFSTSKNPTTTDSDKVFQLVEVSTDPLRYRFKFGASTPTDASSYMTRIAGETTEDPSDVDVIVGTSTLDDTSLWQLDVSQIVLNTENFDASSLSISNPVNDRLIVRGINSDITKLSVYNLLGSKVLTKNLTGNSSVELSVSNLVSGMYIVKLEGANKAFSKKIIKQ